MLLKNSSEVRFKNQLLLIVIMVASVHFKAVAQQVITPEEEHLTAPTVERLMKLGRDAMKGKYSDDAYEIFRDVIREDENNAEALYHYGVLKYQRRDFIGGLIHIERAVELDPGNHLYRYSLASGLKEVGRIEEAIAQYEYLLSKLQRGTPLAVKADMDLGLLLLGKAAGIKNIRAVSVIGAELMRRYSNDVNVVRTVASIYSTVELLAAAKEVYLHLVRLMPDDPLAEYYLATSYEAIKNIPKAQQHYNLAIEKGPATPIANQARIKLLLIDAFASLNQGSKEDARKSFQQVIELDPRNIIANLNAGVLNHELGYLEQARDAYMRILIMNPNNYDVRLRLAVVFLDGSRWVDAVRELDTVIKQAPGTRYEVEATRFLTRVDRELGGKLALIRENIQETVKYAGILSKDPENGSAYLGMGELLVQQGKLAEAKEAFLKAVELDSTLGIAYRNLGLISGQDGEIDDAVRYFQLALALSKDDKNIRENQKQLLAAIGQQDLLRRNYEKSKSSFMEIINQYDEKSIQALWGMALAHEQLAELEEAAEWYIKIIDYYPDEVEARMNLAFGYEQLEEEGKAIAQYRSILKSPDADERMIELAARRLDDIKRRINGFETTVGYFMTFDDNLGYSQTDKIFEYSSDTSASVNYKYKIKKGLTLAVNFTPSYAVYHIEQLDYLTLSISPDLMFNLDDYFLTVGLNKTTQSSLMIENDKGTTNYAFNANLDWVRNKINYNSFVSYSGFGSDQNPFFDARRFSVDLSVSHLYRDLPVRYGYSVVINENKHDLGNDYAYVANFINGRVDKRVTSRLSASLDGRLGLYLYSNIDSLSSTEKRRNVNYLLGGGINYRLTDSSYFSASYHYNTQHSSLATGAVLDVLQAIEFEQSAYLGSYSKHTFSVGLRVDL